MQIAAYNPSKETVAAEWQGRPEVREQAQAQAARTFYQGAGQIAPRSFGRKVSR